MEQLGGGDRGRRKKERRERRRKVVEGGTEAQGEKRCLDGWYGRRKGEMERRESRCGREGEGGVCVVREADRETEGGGVERARDLTDW